MKKVMMALGMSVLFSTAAVAQEPRVPEIVAEMNRLVYEVTTPALKKAWEESKIFGRALVQGVKMDSQGNFYVSTARWGGKEIPSTLSKLVRKGDSWVLQAFPSEEMNNPDNPRGLKAVLGFEIDRNDVMWILDQGKIAGQESKPGDEKLILWDIKANREVQRHEFSMEESHRKCSFLNDLAVDNDSGFAYIADSGIFCNPLHGGLIVYDSRSNKARRILDRTMFTSNEPNFFFNINNRPVLKKQGMQTGADGIALSGDKRTLYWTNLTGNTLWSLDTALLRDFTVSEQNIQNNVKRVTALPSNTDGMTADRDGNIFMTALSLNGLMKFDPRKGTVERFAYHPEMVWPDTLTWGADGSLYVISNHLHLWVDGDMDFEKPAVPNFRIWRIRNVGKSYTAP
jgi:sugar lactone lactonase YvrE